MVEGRGFRVEGECGRVCTADLISDSALSLNPQPRTLDHSILLRCRDQVAVVAVVVVERCVSGADCGEGGSHVFEQEF